MIQFEVFGESGRMEVVAESLEGLEGVSRVRSVGATRPGHVLVAGVVSPGAVDPLLDEVHRHGVEDAEITLSRIEVVGQMIGGSAATSLVWADVLSAAWHHARPIGRFLVLMLIAGVIACYGVTERNAILIIGAMAVSPDLLPITAISVGVVGRSPRLVSEAFLTLALGLLATCAAAALFAFGQDQFDVLPSGFNLSQAATSLGGLTTVNNETIAVALVAGVAGMLALETRASAAVGVAVSVTTIPAAAYLGVAIGLGKVGSALGALGVLGMNVAMMVVGASATLVAQRAINRRVAARRRGVAA
ncbi:MAG: DUF389 domain-containing protein [Solirubrobacterales bacterium]